MRSTLRAFGLWLIFSASILSIHAEPLRVGIDINGEPMTFVDAKGIPGGFAVELMNAIADEMGFKVVYTAKPWEDMLRDFQAGRLDAIANITYTTSRTTFIDFAAPHMVMKGAVFVRKNSPPIKSPADLLHLTVATKIDGSPYGYLQAHGWLGKIVPAPTLRESLRDVNEGRADATLDARIIGIKNIQDEHLSNMEVSDIEVPEFAQRLHIGLHLGDAARLALINEGLARLHTNGVYDRIYDKWIGPLEPSRLRFQDLKPYILPATLVLALIVSALVWQRRLLRRLERQAAALHRSEERLTLVLEGTEDGFWDWDLPTGRFDRSERWAAMLGYAVAEIEATFEAGLRLVHPDDRPDYQRFRDRPQPGKSGRYDVEYRMKTKSGEWRWILNRGKVVARAPDGTPLRMAGTHTDITDLKNAQDEREKLRLKMLDSQKLESLGVLAGGIAHDFNNLLTVILANASLARAEAGHPRAQNEQLADIETAARRAADLCRQMLAYAGRGNFVVERIDLGKLVRDTAQLLSVSISKKAQLALNLTAHLPAIDADISQLQQVVMNLVINASDALGDNPGVISLTTRLDRPKITPGGVLHSFDLPEGDCVCLEVSDTGQGMAPATLARIFDPFFTTKFAGRGLGLAAVLGIVRAHHGALAVESTPGVGTCFRLFLPAVKSTQGTAVRSVTAPPMPAPQGNGIVLIADDEPAVLSIADKLLRRHGYETMLATDGNEAVKHFRANPEGFTAVLLDLTMPGMDGAETLRIIRSLNPSMRVLLMSGYSEQDVLASISDQGSVTVLRKPFTHDTLLAGLTRVIAGPVKAAGAK